MPEPQKQIFDIISIGLTVGFGLLAVYAVWKNYCEPPKVALNPDEYRKFQLISKTIVTHNTRIFRFALQTKTTTLGLPIGKHISVRFFDENKIEDGKPEEVRRPYTPITSDDVKGHFDLLIKVYDNGRMSKHMDGLKINDFIEARGPLGRITYDRIGHFVNHVTSSQIDELGCKSIGMIAGGTGITPMYQIIQEILKNPNDGTKIYLIFGNVSIDDILLQNELEELQKKYNNFTVYFTLDKAPSTWTQGVGYVTKKMIDEHLPKPSDDVVVLNCGPPLMVKSCVKTLEDLGYATNRILKF